jgi:L-seryl-tRNA(Ser) seleniumtransferase
MSPMSSDTLLRSIPSMDRLLNDSGLDPLRAKYAEDLVKRMARLALDELRQEILRGNDDERLCSLSSVIARVEKVADRMLGRKLVPVINATGVIVHTNLGRSPLSEKVIDRIAQAARSYSNLEYDLEKGRRGERNSHLKLLMQELTGAEAALAVNNNAAAVLLVLTSLAAGKEVVVSRGELIEIGGSFRIPDVMKRSGAILREVGTTNRTHPRDYLEAINERTALILKVHTSNYHIVGFTREVDVNELAAIGREKGVTTMMDLGSGCLVDLSRYGFMAEVTVQEVLNAGIDVVTFSGDKLLGGPQAGIIAGKENLLMRIKADPLARALRMDKMTLAGLEATLEEYTKPDGAPRHVPTLQMIVKDAGELLRAAEWIAARLKDELTNLAEIDVQPGPGKVGGGALPLGELAGSRVVIRPLKVSAAALERGLREGTPPVIALVRDEAVLFDTRTIFEDQYALLPSLVREAFERA